MIKYDTDDFIKVDITIEPEDHNLGRQVCQQFLRWVLDNNIYIESGGSYGPKGLLAYVHSYHRAELNAWIKENLVK